MQAINKYKSGKYVLSVYQDENPDSPRNWCNFGKMVCFHKRYELGDKHDYDNGEFGSQDEFENQLKRDGAYIILPIYMYDHSGITISTTPFNCRWDSGQIGFIYVDRETILKKYNVKKVTKTIRERVESMLILEVDTYDQYLRGDVYGFVLTDSEIDDEIDSCWGFYGDDITKNGMLDHLSDEIKNGIIQFA